MIIILDKMGIIGDSMDFSIFCYASGTDVPDTDRSVLKRKIVKVDSEVRGDYNLG